MTTPELRPANLSELSLYFSSTFVYLPGPVMKVLDPGFLAPICLKVNEYYFFSIQGPIKACRPQNLNICVNFDVESDFFVEHAQFLRLQPKFEKIVFFINS